MVLRLLLAGVNCEVRLPGHWRRGDGGGSVGGRALPGVELLVDRHHAVGVDHHVATETVVEVGGVDGGDVLRGGRVPLSGRVVQHLVHSVITRVELERGVQIIQIIKKVQRVNVRKAQLVGSHDIVKLGFNVGIDHLLKVGRSELAVKAEKCLTSSCGHFVRRFEFPALVKYKLQRKVSDIKSEELIENMTNLEGETVHVGVADPVYVGHLGLGLYPVHAGHGRDRESSFVRPGEGRLTGCQLDLFILRRSKTIFSVVTMLRRDWREATLHGYWIST